MTVQRGVDTGTWGQRSSVFSGFVADEWRASSTMTINMGLRYETHTPWVEVYDRQRNFAPFTGEELVPGEQTLYSNSRALYNNYNWGFGNFQPRFGFAWNPKFMNGSFVIRGAYTISSYLEGTGTNLRLTINPPFTTEYNNDYSSLTYPASTTDQGMTVLQSTDPYKGAVISSLEWGRHARDCPAVESHGGEAVRGKHHADSRLRRPAWDALDGSNALLPEAAARSGCRTANPSPSSESLPGGQPQRWRQVLQPDFRGRNPTATRGTMLSASHAAQAYEPRACSAQVAYAYSKCMSDALGYYGSWGSQVEHPIRRTGRTCTTRKCGMGALLLRCQEQPEQLCGLSSCQFGKGKSVGNDWNPVARKRPGRLGK